MNDYQNSLFFLFLSFEHVSRIVEHIFAFVIDEHSKNYWIKYRYKREKNNWKTCQNNVPAEIPKTILDPWLKLLFNIFNPWIIIVQNWIVWLNAAKLTEAQLIRAIIYAHLWFNEYTTQTLFRMLYTNRQTNKPIRMMKWKQTNTWMQIIEW